MDEGIDDTFVQVRARLVSQFLSINVQEGPVIDVRVRVDLETHDCFTGVLPTRLDSATSHWPQEQWADFRVLPNVQTLASTWITKTNGR